ncbi:MAG: type II/IV secretion system protein [Candidatus Hydrogenedentes bacterium]|nr:type II/IV secretion system protein [Candidatus Hydrogenedentota bacterium]
MAKFRAAAPEPARVKDGGFIPFPQLQDALVKAADGGEMGACDAVEIIIRQASHHGASDVHLEPWEDCLSLKYRIDGILHEAARLPKLHQAKVIARIKILAKMVVYQKDIPQDGRIDSDAAAGGQEMRVSTFPTVYGEKIVMRVLGVESALRTLDSLGLRADVVGALREVVERPQGTLLLTGPSSSGKTTTIYALLQELVMVRHPAPHIITIEDPVEYRLPKIAQTEVNPYVGFTFDTALRSALRQDPEIIMIGEIRDAETARTGIQAGLTGHNVISTIHSGTATGVFTRLLDMGVEPFLIASSISGVLAQRLVRLNCPYCTGPYKPDPALLERFNIPEGEGLFSRGKGCEQCQGIGYKGRTALCEMFTMNDEMGELILQRARTRSLHDVAVRNHMVTLIEDGVRRAKEGHTTLEELKRVLPMPGS